MAKHHQQLQFDWDTKPASPKGTPSLKSANQPQSADAPASLPHNASFIQVLPWDFRGTFPEPLDEAISSGELHDTDILPDNLKALHDEHEREALALLRSLDAVCEARRFG